MYAVYFENQRGIICPIGAGKDYRICMAIIDEFLREHKFKSYYKQFTNIEVSNGKLRGKMTCVDVGSHVEFFYIKPAMDLSLNGDKK